MDLGIRYRNIIYILILLVASGCQSTKYIPEGHYLLSRVSVETDNIEIPDKEFEEQLRQKPNKKIFGFARFHLGLYNLSNPDKENWYHNWLRKIGEGPVIYKPELNRITSENLKLFLEDKGFHHGQITDTVVYKNSKAYLTYRVESGLPHIINKLNWNDPGLIPDQQIRQLLLEDSLSRLVSKGDRFDKDLLRNERLRISNRLNETGYYGFIKEYIYYQADTTKSDYSVDLFLGIQNPVFTDVSLDTLSKHPRFRIRDIRVVGDFEPREYMQNPGGYFQKSDTMRYQDIDFIYNNRLPVRKNLINSCLYFHRGELYNQAMVNKTYKAFQGLRNFKTTNIRFIPGDHLEADSLIPLDCQIELNPAMRQRYDLSLEVTHSSGNLGMAGNLIYKHKNLFHGAEEFQLKFKGAMEFIANSPSDFNQMIEFGVDASLDVPQFWLPVRFDRLQQRYSPRTDLNFSYNYQQRPDFTRTISTASFGYNWRGRTFENHQVNVVDLNYVNVSDMTEEFSDFISGKYIESSYRSHVVPAFNYTYTFSNQNPNKEEDFVFMRIRPEIAGNLFTAGYTLSGADRPENGFNFFNTPYAQYAMADIDLRYHEVLNDANRLAFRVFAGAGYPYGNANALPFEKKYFSGGSNGIRAWQVRSLGPGRYVVPDEQKTLYPNQLGDIKLEANAEYRFDLFWQLEGAVFIDAGNIWAINSADEREGAIFRIGSFYKDLAVGTGMGLRLDLSFLIIRLDLGAKLRDPGYISGPEWFPKYDSYFKEGIALNFGIGYPF